jgi:DNA invertase Pin-like site-specific DNA recombinase
VASQKATITAACRDRHWELLEIVEDIGFSGRDLRRPAMQAALLRLADGKANCLVVAKLDRLSRSLLDFAGLSDQARRGGWGLVTLDLMVDTTTPAGEALASVLATFAQFERKMIGLRIREALHQLRAQSRVYSTYTPLGFRREGGALVRDRAQQRTVAKARALYADTGSFRRVAAWLNEQGLLSAGGAPWRSDSVKRMFRLNDLIGCPLDQIPPEAPTPRNLRKVPFGYRVDAGELVVDVAEQAVIGRMRVLRQRGFSFRQIAGLLTDEGVPTKRNAPTWNKTTIERILDGRGPLRAKVHARDGKPPDVIAGPPRPRVTPAPYGYRARIHKLVPHHGEQLVIRRMRRMRATGAGYRQIAARLDALGIPPTRSTHWHHETVRRIVEGRGPVRTRHGLASPPD